MNSADRLISDLTQQFDWLSINTGLTNYTTKTVSVSITKDYDLDIVSSLLRSEFFESVLGSIIKSLFNTSRFDWVDFRNDLEKNVNLNLSIKKIISSRYRNLVSDPKTIIQLQDFESYSWINNAVKPTSIYLYEAGLIGNVRVWSNSKMRFGDSRICLFDKVDLNIQNIKIDLSDSSPMMAISYDIDFNVNNCQLLFIIEDDSSESYKHLQSLNRDIKINDVLK